MLAIHLLNRDPQQPILLLSGDQVLGGTHLEPVVASRLNPAAKELTQPFVVSSWPACYLICCGTPALQEDEVVLLDPLQVGLELQGRMDPSMLVAFCGTVTLADSVLSWDHGSSEIDRLIDLDPLLGRGGGRRKRDRWGGRSAAA